MGRHPIVAAAALTALVWALPAAGQGPDPGVTFTRLIDRDEIRISRVVLEAGATRSLHAHDDVEYHAWVPLEGTLELTLGDDDPVPAVPGDAFFLERGTRHGFKNVGSMTAAVMEVFVKQGGRSAAREALAPEVLAALIGAAGAIAGNTSSVAGPSVAGQ